MVIEEEHTFQQSEYEENEHDAASCEQWARGKKSPPVMTFQPNWMHPKNPPYTSFNNHDGCKNVQAMNQQVAQTRFKCKFSPRFTSTK